MEMMYDIGQYITSVRMSRKKRVLVEGKDDKSHFKNLLFTVIGENTIQVDTAESIKGICKTTAKNNRAKIDMIHHECCTTNNYENLFFLKDREFSEFKIDRIIEDQLQESSFNKNLFLTQGHSFENYFFDLNIFSVAYSYLTNSEYKNKAIQLFSSNLPESLNIISAISLAAYEIEKATYPLGVIKWDDFEIINEKLIFPIDKWKIDDSSEVKKSFSEYYKKYYEISCVSEEIVKARICRGHTAIQLFQRIFSACLNQIGKNQNDTQVIKHANNFSKLKESNLSSALCESWLNSIKDGNKNYPYALVESLT